MKKIGKFTLATFLAGCLCLNAACGGRVVEHEKDPTISYLYVDTYEGGVGKEWLEILAREFEERNKDAHYAEGKTGVRVEVDGNKQNLGSELRSTIKSSSINISFVEKMYYPQYVAGNLLLDLTDVVDDELSDGSGTIASKIYSETDAYLKAYGGRYYAVPWLSGFNGVMYDAGLFEDKLLYFADSDGLILPKLETSSYTGSTYRGLGTIKSRTAKKSCGPDGVYDTFDDGLPSTSEEFFYLLDFMLEKGIDPFIYTGASPHYLNYLFQTLIMSFSEPTESASMFTFDSGEDAISIVKFDNSGEPYTESVRITSENGYMTRQTAGRYRAIKFLGRLFSNPSYFYPNSHSKSFSNLNAQNYFIESNLDTGVKPVGMMIEGNYWYNEAADGLEDSVLYYGESAKNRRFAYMPMPIKETGTVKKGQGKSVSLADGLYYYVCVNNNIKDDDETRNLAIDFLKFCFEENSLRAFTKTTGIPLAVKYSMDDVGSTENYDSMCNYYKSLWDVYSQAQAGGTYISNVSASPIFLSNIGTFAFTTDSSFFSTEKNTIRYANPREAFNAGLTVKEFFIGMSISETVWQNSYNK
ncbi:MAG: extracellular solute-binding protein [Clostridia bacterium]|nr:extracellular solute-binding protein [Clostridia bacterium]